MHETRSVLIIDDEESQRRTLSLILKKRGYFVETAGTGKEALETAKNRTINLALLDITLPDIDGIELVAPLQSINPDMTIIMVTGFASVENTVRSLNAGASGYLVKPINHEELLAKVQDFLERQDLIRDKRQAEVALQESEERYRLLLQNAHDMIFVHEITGKGPGKFLEVNDKICITLGYTREELLAMNVRDIDVPEHNERIAAIFKDLFTHHHVTIKTEYFTKDGCRVPVEISAALFDLRGRPTVLAIVRDVTDRKQAEEALRQANKQLNLLSSITRHDILNQLMTLKGYLGLSHEVIDNPATLIEYIIKEETAANAIEDQIMFTKDYQELGAAAPAWQNVNANIQKAVAGLPMRDVRVDVDRTDLDILSDPLFEKAFYNLIDNALRYGGAEMKTIRVSSQEIDTCLTILCEDDGVGITAEDKKRLFTQGFGKNTGLGLFLSREILGITGITITENGIPGKGARFEIMVPNGAWRSTGKGA